jgi:hypothetical protein
MVPQLDQIEVWRVVTVHVTDSLYLGGNFRPIRLVGHLFATMACVRKAQLTYMEIRILLLACSY